MTVSRRYQLLGSLKGYVETDVFGGKPLVPRAHHLLLSACATPDENGGNYKHIFGHATHANSKFACRLFDTFGRVLINPAPLIERPVLRTPSLDISDEDPLNTAEEPQA